MAGKSLWLKNQWLNHVLKGATYTPPSTEYIALFTSDPTDLGTGTEVSGGGYSRQVITFTTSTAASSSNAADILFPVASAAWGTVTHFATFDALTGGHMLYFGPLTPNKAVASADQIKIATGALTINET